MTHLIPKKNPQAESFVPGTRSCRRKLETCGSCFASFQWKVILTFLTEWTWLLRVGNWSLLPGTFCLCTRLTLTLQKECAFFAVNIHLRGAISTLSKPCSQCHLHVAKQLLTAAPSTRGQTSSANSDIYNGQDVGRWRPHSNHARHFSQILLSH